MGCFEGRGLGLPWGGLGWLQLPWGDFGCLGGGGDLGCLGMPGGLGCHEMAWAALGQEGLVDLEIKINYIISNQDIISNQRTPLDENFFRLVFIKFLPPVLSINIHVHPRLLS